MRYIVIFIFILFVSCSEQKVEKRATAGFYINVIDSLDNRADHFLLSSIVKDIEIVPLEMNENYLYRKINNIVMGSKDIFLNGTGHVLRYSREGKFLNPVGTKGMGPSDHMYAKGIGIDDTSHIVYVLSGITPHIKAYTYEGKFIKATQIAPDGSIINGTDHSARKGTNRGSAYAFIDKMHFLRRMLPIWDGSSDIWLMQRLDTAGRIVRSFYDPVNRGKEKGILSHGADGVNLIPAYWTEVSPVINRYGENMNILYEGNDTVYGYNIADNVLKRRHILLCGQRPDFVQLRKMGKEADYFRYLMIVDVMETEKYIFFVGEKDSDSYLIRVSKEDGSIKTVMQEGEIKESQLMGIIYRLVDYPHFIDDMSGGLPFTPVYHDEKHWIDIRQPEELLEMNLEKLKNTDVILPEMREKLIHMIENLKEDDNPVLIIATLK
ncbi:MAG: 6-bladed beta-propeller [Tannerellaceae bacterium]|jgi:hypothetical protein|nr:6-bladed beta-propeller [Tannerellaceae bacterium]